MLSGATTAITTSSLGEEGILFSRHALAECVLLVPVGAVPVRECLLAEERALRLAEVRRVAEVVALGLADGDPQPHAVDRGGRRLHRRLVELALVLRDLDPDRVAGREAPAVAVQLVGD